MMRRSHGYLVVRVGQEWYGFAVEAVIEVLHLVALNELPGSDILGVMTLRNRVINVVDLRQRFGVPEPTYKLDTPLIVVYSGDRGIGFVVDEADDVIQRAADEISSYSAEFVTGTFRHQERLVFVIDPARLIGSLNLIA